MNSEWGNWIVDFDPTELDSARVSVHLDKMNVFNADASEIYEELRNVLCSKQNDYGPGNINNAPGGPINGLLVRMNDKMERLKNLMYNGAVAKNESIEDSFVDIANYAVIALMVRRGVWPE